MSTIPDLPGAVERIPGVARARVEWPEVDGPAVLEIAFEDGVDREQTLQRVLATVRDVGGVDLGTLEALGPLVPEPPSLKADQNEPAHRGDATAADAGGAPSEAPAEDEAPSGAEREGRGDAEPQGPAAPQRNAGAPSDAAGPEAVAEPDGLTARPAGEPLGAEEGPRAPRPTGGLSRLRRIVTDDAEGVWLAEGPRPAFRELRVERGATDVRVTVTLDWHGRALTGQATTVATDRGTLQATAEATLQAVAHLLPPEAAARVEWVDADRAGVAPGQVTVGATLLVDGREESVLGGALVRRDRWDAAVRASLDALNRQLVAGEPA